MKSIIVTLVLVILVGCASLPTPQEVAVADYGSYPSNYEKIVKKFYDNTLKDPDSAKYRNITTPKKYWLGDRISGAKFGYLVCVTLNAINSFGAYIGYHADALLIRNGAVIQYVKDGMWGGKQICK